MQSKLNFKNAVIISYDFMSLKVVL